MLSRWSSRQQRERSDTVCRLVAVTALAIAGLVAGHVHPVAARPSSKKNVSVRPEPARPTAAWTRFCAQQPGECAVDATEPEIIPLTPEALALVTAINKRVNDTISPVTDQEHWGVQDRWDYPDDGMGDCEDIQLLKRKLLVDQGLPRRALRMTVVIDKKGEGHAVLTVRTSEGDLILDNARDAVLPWRQTGYHFVKREGADGRTWVFLDGWRDSVVTAAR
jgi:predicted transglutaminase-like cysteine proteinase